MRKRFVPALCLAGVFVLAAPAQVQAESKKDPLVAGLLGGLVGFGSGYYYTEATTKGVIFSVVDLGLRGGLVTTIGADEDGLKIGLGTAALASAIWQGIDGANEAKKYNGRHGLGFLAQLPVGFDLGLSAMPSYSSERINTLWADGGASRQVALGMSMMQDYGPPVRFSLGLDDPGVGLSWSSHF